MVRRLMPVRASLTRRSLTEYPDFRKDIWTQIPWKRRKKQHDDTLRKRDGSVATEAWSRRVEARHQSSRVSNGFAWSESTNTLPEERRNDLKAPVCVYEAPSNLQRTLTTAETVRASSYRDTYV